MSCSTEGCEKRAHARGWCQTCYSRARNEGTLAAGPRRTRPHGLTLDEAIAWHFPNPRRTERGCLVGWEGGVVGHEGRKRPQMSFNGRPRHAAAWVCELTYGPKPSEDYHAAHTCDNPDCLEPSHIVWLPSQENMRARDASVTVGVRSLIRRFGAEAVLGELRAVQRELVA